MFSRKLQSWYLRINIFLLVIITHLKVMDTTTTIKWIEDFFTALSLAVIEAGKIFKKLLFKTTYFSLI
jgi:hypothetical protein